MIPGSVAFRQGRGWDLRPHPQGSLTRLSLGMPHDLAPRSIKGAPDWMRRFRLMASPLAVLAILVTLACGSSQPGAAPSATTVGSGTPAAPAESSAAEIERTPFPTAAASDVPSCGVGDLTATFMGGQGLTGGSVQSWIALRNSSDSACSLQGTPDLTFLDSAGTPLQVASYRGSPCRGALPCPYFPVARLNPGAAVLPHLTSPGTAAFSLIWSAHDPATGNCQSPPPDVTGIRLALPSGGGEIDVTGSQENPVRLKPCGPWVSVGWIIASGELQNYLDYRLDAQIQEPPPVSAGQKLSYRVSLGPSLAGGGLPKFDPCPSGSALASPGAPLGEPQMILVKRDFTIDCASVAESITTYGGTTILGKIDIPAELPPGTYTLTWFLDPSSDFRATAQAAFEVKSP